jgi:hypothetical protein
MARRERFKDKSPTEAVDYAFNWDTRLSTDAISSSSWAITGADSSLTNVTDSTSGDTTTIRLSGGTSGYTYYVKNTVVTTAGQTLEQTAIISISTR